jgi:hypothetical protein
MRREFSHERETEEEGLEVNKNNVVNAWLAVRCQRIKGRRVQLRISLRHDTFAGGFWVSDKADGVGVWHEASN